YRHRGVGALGADEPGRGGRPAESAPDRQPRPDPGVGGLQRGDQLGRDPGRRLLRVAVRDRHHQRRAGHLRLRPVAERPGTGPAAPARGRGHRHGTGHQPGLDVLHVLPAPAAPGQPDPGQPAAGPGAAAEPLLHPGQPRLHRGVRPVTTRARAAGVSPAGPGALARFPLAVRWLAAAVETARPRQWPKNLLVFAAPLAGASLGRDDGLGYALAAAAVFTMAAAAVYFVNDVADAERDRRRPVASGRLPRPHALGLAALGVLAAEAVCLGLGESVLAGLVAVYVALSILYTLVLKHLPVVELVFVAGGFVLRALGGASATRVPPSGWFLVVCSLGALLVAIAKRFTELEVLGPAAATHRPVM